MKKFVRFVKNNIRTIGSGVVVFLLAIFCIVTLVEKNTSQNIVMAKMVSITPLYQDNILSSAYNRITYEAANINNGVYADEFGADVGAYSEGRQLTEQQQKDKAALEALLASNESFVSEEQSAGDISRDRRKKYQVNDIKEVNNNFNVSVTMKGSSSGGNSAVGTATYANGANGAYQGQFLLTGYCPCVICCGKTNGITASGALATSNHTIAADSRYKFGTKLVIFGQVYTVEDRGGAIQGNHIDIFFNTHAEALAFGKKYADVYLYTGSDDTSSTNSNTSSGSSNSNNSNSTESTTESTTENSSESGTTESTTESTTEGSSD